MKTHFAITSRICKNNIKIFQEKYLGCTNSDLNQLEIFDLSNKDKVFHFKLKTKKKEYIKDFSMLLLNQEEFLLVLTTTNLFKINIATKKEETFDFNWEEGTTANILIDIETSYNPNDINKSHIFIHYAYVSEKTVKHYYDILNIDCKHIHTSIDIDSSEYTFISKENYYGILTQFGLKIFNSNTNKEAKLNIFPNIPLSALELSFSNDFYFLNNTLYCETHKSIYEMPLVYNEEKNSLHIEEYFTHKKKGLIKVEDIQLVKNMPTALFNNSFSNNFYSHKYGSSVNPVLYNFKTRKAEDVFKRMNQLLPHPNYASHLKLIWNHLYCNISNKLILFNL